ncbi:MAG: hypothetical protein AAF447_05960, partial [Myxococcota bacterium]
MPSASKRASEPLVSFFSAPRRAPALKGSLALALALVSVVRSVPAAAEGPLRARFLGPADPELEARVRGQTSDLEGWTFERDPRPVPEGAEAVLDRSEGAAVVFWVRGEGARLTVYVLDARSRRLLVRDLTGGDGEPLGLSAAREAVGLVIRGALQALRLGDPLGEVLEAAPGDPPPESPRPEHATSDATADPAPRPREPLDGFLTAGWGLARDVNPVHGPRLALALGRRGIAGELRYAVTLPFVLEATDLRVELLRHRVTAQLRLRLAGGSRGDLALALGIGWLRVRRTTEAQGTLLPTPTRRSDHLLVTARAEGTFALGAGLSLVLTLGLDAVVAPPEL